MTKTNYKGSQTTASQIAKQIAERWGEEEIKNYNPLENCMTYKKWTENGYRIKKGERALKTFTIVEKKNKEDEIIAKYSKVINLFYIKQVEKIK